MSVTHPLPQTEEDGVSRLNAHGWARLLGTSADEIEALCGHLLTEFDLRYEVLEEAEYESVLLNVIQTMNDHKLSVSGRKRKNDWEAGWCENLKDFVNSGYDLERLIPKYMHKFSIRRLFGRYVRPVDPNFEVNFYTVYRHYLFQKYLTDFDPVFEFGCGTGYNIVILARLFPDKSLMGLDWSNSSVELIRKIANKYNFNLQGRLFNFFEPDDSLSIPQGSAFLTLNALEQLGGEYELFLNFILEKRPAICVNSEPFVEMYDEENLLDYLAARYHYQRNYLSGYYLSLLNLEKQGRITILRSQKVPSGNLFHEGYSIVAWKPE